MIIYLCLSSNYVFYLCSTCSTINVTDSKQCYLYFICQVFLTYTCISSGIIFFSFQCKWLCIPLWLSKLCILSLSMISLEIDVSQSVSLKKKKSHHTPNKNPATKQTSLSNLLLLRSVQRQRNGAPWQQAAHAQDSPEGSAQVCSGSVHPFCPWGTSCVRLWSKGEKKRNFLVIKA